MANLPVLSRVSKYEARDGTTFESRKDATVHQTGLDLMKQFMTMGFQNNGELKRFCIAFAKNYPQIRDSVDVCRRAHLIKE